MTFSIMRGGQKNGSRSKVTETYLRESATAEATSKGPENSFLVATYYHVEGGPTSASCEWFQCGVSPTAFWQCNRSLPSSSGIHSFQFVQRISPSSFSESFLFPSQHQVGLQSSLGNSQMSVQ